MPEAPSRANSLAKDQQLPQQNEHNFNADSSHRRLMPRRMTQPREPLSAPVRFTLDELLKAREQLNEASVNFLLIDVDIGLTFSEIALQTSDPDKKRRVREKARAAYENVQHLVHKVTLTEADACRLARNLEILRARLYDLEDED